MRAYGLVVMRFVSVIVVACAALAGCGGGGDEPAAARDASVQRPAASVSSKGAAADGGVLRGTYTRLNGARDNLARYHGDVVLVVNTATECGYTPQLAGLQALYRRHRAAGLVVLGFPANDFAGQEPRSSDEIAEFCEANYGVTFPMFAKTTVVGGKANPLFRSLSEAAGAPEWNFNKYLVDRSGKGVARFGAGTEPDGPELTQRLEALL